MPGNKPAYSISPDGEIRRLNQIVGRLDLDSGQITLDIDIASVGMTHLKAQAFDLMAARKAGPAAVEQPRGKPLIEVLCPTPPPAETREQEPSLLDIGSRDEYASFQPPPPPEMDPRLGDKTPAWMNWLGTYFPEEFRKRYKGRKTHLTTGINPHLSSRGDVPESHFTKESSEEWR